MIDIYMIYTYFYDKMKLQPTFTLIRRKQTGNLQTNKNFTTLYLLQLSKTIYNYYNSLLPLSHLN